MTPLEVQAAFAAIDGIMTAANYIAEAVRKAQREGMALAPEQQARLDAVERIRAAVGLPKPQ